MCIRQMVKHTQREDEIKIPIRERESFWGTLYERYVGSPHISFGDAKSFCACIRGYKPAHERGYKHIPSSTTAAHVQDLLRFLGPVDE